MLATQRAAALAVALFSAAIALSGCGGADARRESHLSRGEKYLADGNLEKAQVEFRNALQIAPNDVKARLAAARVAEKLGNIRGAAGFYQSVIDMDADNAVARASLGRIYVFSGSPDRAVEMVEPALAKHPDDADLLTVRGAARSQQNNRAGALVDAERAAKIAPDNENAVALLASLYKQRGDTGKAIELIEGTLKRLPGSVDLRQVLANLYLTVDQPEPAEAQLRKVVELRPKEPTHRYQLAVFYARYKRLDDAERVLKEAMAAQPDQDEPKLSYVEFLTAQRSPQDGAKALAAFIKQSPEDYDLQLGLGALQQKTGHIDQALATYRSVIESAGDKPQGLSARNRIAAVLVSQRKLDEASQLISAVLEKNPRDNDALLLRGNLAMEKKDSATAIADLRAVLRDQPGAVPVMRTLARAHLANGEPALAEESLRNALEVAPKETSVRVELAQLLMQTNRVDSAVPVLEEAVKSAPTDVPAREALVRAYLVKKDFPSARRSAEDLKILAPDRAVGYYLAGVAAQGENRAADAQKDLERALELQPSAVDALAAITRQDMSTGHEAQALARVKTVVVADANSPTDYEPARC
jgi:tetratricopeptide (TPR) repeat protein